MKTLAPIPTRTPLYQHYIVTGFWLLLAVTRAVTGAEVTVGKRTFSLPAGLEVELVAGPPLVNRPISFDFDTQGNLYVTDSSGSNDNVQVQLQKRPHRVVRLVDVDSDGVFDRQTVFADRLMFPEGALWHDGSLYVAAPPSIWKLTDTDGDGIADQRQEWFQGTLTGCANDLHGPYLGPEGWLYWCKGAFAKQVYERVDGPSFLTRAAHIFRRDPRSGLIEPVMTGGMDNPVEVAFTPAGERIFTTTFLQHPRGGKRDGLIHAIYGGVYGKRHSVIDEHARTGPVLPTLVHLDAAAPCGLTRLETDQLGASYQDSLLACLFNMRKVTRHTLQSEGSTFRSHNEDLLVAHDLDFHPTDVIEDADGSVLVADTGGWYKLCCPTSQLYKPDVLGAIYRIRRSGAHRIKDPRGINIDWGGKSVSEVAAHLGDPRPRVRAQSVEQLARRGPEVVEALVHVLQAIEDPLPRLNAVWTLARIDSHTARAAVREALADRDEQVCQAAIHSVSIWRDHDARDALVELLRSSSLHNRRAAAEALGRVGLSEDVAAILSAAAYSQDRVLEHSLTFALIEINAPEQTRLGLSGTPTKTRRATLLALDQMRNRTLEAADVEPLLDNTDTQLQQTAWWIAERHSEWGGEFTEYFQRQLTTQSLPPEGHKNLATRLATFASQPAIETLMGSVLDDPDTPPAVGAIVLRAIARSRRNTPPSSWSGPLEKLLAGDNPGLRTEAVTTVRTFRPESLPKGIVSELRDLANNPSLDADLRLAALTALPLAVHQFSATTFEFVGSQVAADRPPRTRSLAADVLRNGKLSRSQLEDLTEVLVHAGPVELRDLLPAFEQASDEPLGLRLVSALERSNASSTLGQRTLRQLLARFGPNVTQRAKSLFSRIVRENSEKRQRLESILKLLATSDVRRGQQVFHSSKTACGSCHELGYLGGSIGPSLTRIGRIRSERDLLEAILFPSASFVRSYEPVTIVTSDGQVHNGVVRDDNANELVLALDAQKTVRVDTSQIVERRPATDSIMPAGLEKQLTPQQLADLVAFLKVAQ